MKTLVASSALFAALFLAMPVHAGEKTPFEQQSFSAAQEAGQPILVDIAAPWCPVCRAQEPIIGALLDDERYDDLQVFTVDFDNQKDVVRALGAQSQSTLIMYRGDEETDRSVGVTDPAAIEALVRSAYEG